MSAASHRLRIAAARELANSPGRWQITLECGHYTVITSRVRPSFAHCRECAKLKPVASA